MRAQELRQAVQDCRARALHASAKWAAAALCGLPEEEVMGSPQAPPPAAAAASSSPAYELARSFFDLKVSAILPGASSRSSCMWQCIRWSPVQPALRPAVHQPCRCPFPPLHRAPCRLIACPRRLPVAAQEYRSAAHALQDSHDQLSVFLRGYATYLAGEKRKE
jgi:anaphase-promoting complex subunit 8